jgi:transposase
LGRQSKYPEEFRRQAAMLVVDGQRPAREVARELGVNHETLRNWVDGLKRERAAPGGPISPDERAELARLRRRVAELELEKEILKKSRGLLRQGDGAVSRGEILAFIASEHAEYEPVDRVLVEREHVPQPAQPLGQRLGARRPPAPVPRAADGGTGRLAGRGAAAGERRLSGWRCW